jgi:hypothetical protein
MELVDRIRGRGTEEGRREPGRERERKKERETSRRTMVLLRFSFSVFYFIASPLLFYICSLVSI